MARLDEIAEGICTILAASQTPEPLNISLRGEGNAETTFLVRAIIESCQRQGLPISEVCVAPDVGADLLKQYAEQAFGYNGITMVKSERLTSEIEIYRFPRNNFG